MAPCEDRSMDSNDIDIAIDRGGTFCDVIATVGDQSPYVFKILSEDPGNYSDAPTEAIRRVLERAQGRSIPRGEKLDGSRIGAFERRSSLIWPKPVSSFVLISTASCRIGTTVATNALLEQKGERFAFVATKGFKDVCIIGDQTRPDIFALRVEKAKALHDRVIEVDERITIEDYDLNPSPLDKSSAAVDADPGLRRTESGEVVRVLKAVDTAQVRGQLLSLRSEGYTSLAISFLHSYLYPDHERIVEGIARDVGFRYVSISSDTSRTIKYLRRSTSVCSEAYLYPVIRRYIEGFETGFDVLPRRTEFMCSDGGLKQAARFGGNEALVSGPAGGVVGVARSCYFGESADPLIGLDMGGTSTDVCRFDGHYDYLTESRIANRTLNVPMLNIQTVAAGGGSILFARNGLLVVGPESAGAYPGPASYRNGGPLTVTDANLFLNRLDVTSFPSVFGPGSNEPLDLEIVKEKFRVIADDFNAQTSQHLTPEEVACGFINVANETMSRPIRNATEARGYAPEKHNLVSFGGAGGQHACAIADRLGIRRILIHKWSSLLSAYGISQSQLRSKASEPHAADFSLSELPRIRRVLDRLRCQVQEDLVSQGASKETLTFDEVLGLHYFGTDTILSILRPDDDDYGKAFRTEHLREFAFNLDRRIIIDSITVRGSGTAGKGGAVAPPTQDLAAAQTRQTPAKASKVQTLYIDGAWRDSGVYRLADVERGTFVDGPALILDETQTIVVEARFRAYILPDHVIIDRVEPGGSSTSESAGDDTFSPIQLSVFAHRFMSIAEQMGSTLQRTAISTSIRERLDFSCAIFSSDGQLVANAPHIPIHLGSMQLAIQAQHKLWRGKLQPGDVLMSNHPEWGGTHLPDITVITPIFVDGQVAFYTASRGHHTDIGGKGITSMMPDSKELWEEGLNVTSMKIVSGGEFLEDEVRRAFELAGSFPGCSPTRRFQDNVSDLKAQISSNQRGLKLLGRLCDEFSLPTVQRYMGGIQLNAEAAVRRFLRDVAAQHPDGLGAEDVFDNGTKIKLGITVDAETGSAVFNFDGTGPQCWSNINCPISIAHSAVIYTLRCLIDMDIPLNQGCLAPVEIRVPKGSVLNPQPSVAVCGSTLASQRVIDVILRAFHCVAAFQGCASSFGWGIGGRNPDTGKIEPGWNYGESIGGGTGAGPGWHGEHATHVHSTNTRITDAEVVEKRTPVLVRRHEINRGSGGRGRWNGGDGITREIEARIPMRSSILSERRVFAPYGVDGGQPGNVGENAVFRRNAEGGLDKINLGSQAVVDLRPGELMQIKTPGGGGWGVPLGS
ncbi:5-oxoprolinase (ATP-hydrolysing) [Geosmithia morbida]|uniref:5-oxoprolinase (ATP-hydrolysing) n=1 Tax=Geosmithia morbida TaxID=1094350 RepID=A0A9P4YPD9_9HYPO|nr:5-oxoprolinase (ATP-hydrolysing) [Geosmithia morbida]KAF4119293.1 5-oxoprolinase (ATP-hydrolysing) [Geosmithia morbida]